MGTIIVAVMCVVVGVVSAWACRKVADLAGDRRDGRTVQGIAVLGRVLLVGGLALAAISFVWSAFQVIPAGHVGIVTLFGSVRPQPLPEGLHAVNPLVDVTRLSVQVHKHEGKYDAASKDLQALHVNMVLNFRLIPEQAPEVYQRIGKSYSTVIIDPAAQEVLKATTALHNASEILFQRPRIKAEVQTGLTVWLAKYGIELREASLANIEFDSSYQRAIETKQIEEQKAEQKRYELVQAQRQAEIAAAKAKGEGDAARERARGEAEALRLKGEAEAAYNAQVAASLTPVLIQQQYLSRWDGKLPVYTLAGSNGVLLQLPGGDAGVKK
jgi:regulator of protease activity HflC (stomatin/prohibitin superfamily)